MASSELASTLVNQADTMVINSGNIINSDSLKKRVSQKSSEELADSIGNALSAWTSTIGPDSVNIPEPWHTLNISNRALAKTYSEDRRLKLKISAKIFLIQWEPELVRKAVDNVCKSLGIKKLDSVLVSFPDSICDFGKVMAVWKEMEAMVDEGMINHVGVVDFDKQAIDDLYQCANVKPTIDQISTSNTCIVPEDLEKFSQEYDIELLSHDDAPGMISVNSLRKIIQEKIPQASSAVEWVPSYVVRYSAIERCRGIVRAKGYIVEAGK